MGYFNDVIGTLLLKDAAYKKVGNDSDALRKVIYAYLFSTYLVLGILSSFALLVGHLFKSHFADLLMNNLAPLTVAFFVTPFILLTLSLVFTLIPHVIGLVMGGKPKNYLDFFKVFMYHYPVASFFVIPFQRILGPIYSLLKFGILYKTYKNIHKLSPQKAFWAVVVNILLTLAALLVMVIFISYCWNATGVSSHHFSGSFSAKGHHLMRWR